MDKPDLPKTQAGEDAGLQADIFGILHPVVAQSKYQTEQLDLDTALKEQILISRLKGTEAKA